MPTVVSDVHESISFVYFQINNKCVFSSKHLFTCFLINLSLSILKLKSYHSFIQFFTCFQITNIFQPTTKF